MKQIISGQQSVRLTSPNRAGPTAKEFTSFRRIASSLLPSIFQSPATRAYIETNDLGAYAAATQPPKTIQIPRFEGLGRLV